MNKKNQIEEYKTFRIDVVYHGVLFFGYATQKSHIRSVQAKLEKLLSYLFKTKISLVASGRTDAGVHALNQVCSFRTKSQLPIEAKQILKFLSKKLDRDIFIKKVQKVNNNFHAQFCVKNKTYEYLIHQKFDLKKIHLSYLYQKQIDLIKLKKALNLFVGTYDFFSFTTAANNKSTIRKINFIKVKTTNNNIKIIINGNGFMRYMVRMIIGSALAYQANLINWEQLNQKLITPKKGSAQYKAPSHGLYLKKIYY